MSHLILASGSEWRKKLLSWLDVPFEVVESGFDEKSINLQDPEELVAVLRLLSLVLIR
jgi:predicted house-cleaning NTP pyrophosphatase (Maf/HAM1 superfamily)